MSNEPIEVEAILRAALELPADARPSFLDKQCVDHPELRAEVERRLAAYVQDVQAAASDSSAATGTFESDDLQKTIVDSQSASRRVSSGNRVPLGNVIAGRYLLKKAIGEGGMGSVYLAEQLEPVRRQVALKLIKIGTDSRTVIARFDAERQALAMMDHPNIARVYDGGSTDDGQPYFVMELVDGVPLTEYCDRHRLSVRDRLELFVTICSAVQHAHQKGIIHRDLKPGNVLVTDVDGRPTPKVIDFGVAKATEQKLTDMSFADLGAIVGTPAYMSPEQANPKTEDIDTRTDIYALGVVLYELLTGSPPIDKATLGKAAILEMLRIVREIDPPRPSTKISAADTLPNIAANRRIEPARLTRLLRGELDWVVMKALEKDRNRRYETANAFAGDIRRFLADEVVEAKPPSRSYRLWKFVRRYRGQVVAASLVLLALLGGMVGTTLGLLEARQQAAQARAATAEKELALQKEAAQAERERIAKENAEAMTRHALNTNNIMVFEIQRELENHPGMQTLRIKLLKQARQGLSEILEQARRQGAPDHTIVSSHYQLGDLEWNLGDTLAAQQEFQAGFDVAQKILDADGSDVSARRDVGNGYTKFGDAAMQMGNTTEALNNFQQARQVNEAIVAANPEDLEAQRSLSIDLDKIGDVALRQGNAKDALEIYERALVIRKLLVAKAPESVRPNRELSSVHTRLGDAHLQLGSIETALVNFKQALNISQRLADRNPANTRVQRDLGLNLTRVGNVTRQLGMQDETLDYYRRGKDVLKALADDDPKNAELQRDLCGTYERLGDAHLMVEQADEALGYYKQSLSISEALAAADPNNAELQRDLSINTEKLGDVLIAFSQPEQSLGYYQTALEISQRLAVADPENAQAQSDVGYGYLKLGEATLLQGKYAEAVDFHSRALSIRQSLAAKDPENAQSQTEVFRSYCLLAEASMAGDDFTLATQWWTKATESLSSMLDQGWYSNPNQMLGDTTLAETRKQLALQRQLCENAERALDDIDFVFEQDAEQIPRLVQLRVKKLLEKQQIADALQSIDRLSDWIETQTPDRNVLRYNAACGYALCIPMTADSEALVEKSIQLLKKAEADGYFGETQIEQLRQDQDFDAIRENPNFAAFVESLD